MPPLRSRKLILPTVRVSLMKHSEIRQHLLQLHASTDVTQFWAALRVLLGEAAQHDALIVYLNFFDFASSWKAAKILSTANASRPTAWFERRRQVDMTPQFVLAQHVKLKLYRLSDVIPDSRQLQQTAFFQDYLQPGGWHHLAVALFWDGANVCSQIALRRTESQGDFSEDEFKLLQELHPHIETVHNRLIAQEEERVRRQWLEEFSDHLPFALLFLNLEFKPVYVNREGMEQSAMWNFGPQEARAYRCRDVFRVPNEILSACAELKERWLGRRSSSASPPPTHLSIRRLHPKYPELVANLTLQTETPSSAAKPGFVVYLSRLVDNSEAGSSLPIHSMLGKLTTAEREIVRLLLAGHSNEEISDQLRKSVNTVKGQLTHVYKKLGVASRSRLLASIR
jgi:DNA-binding CsgD family transcriptional regulator